MCSLMCSSVRWVRKEASEGFVRYADRASSQASKQKLIGQTLRWCTTAIVETMSGGIVRRSKQLRTQNQDDYNENHCEENGAKIEL